MNKSIKTPEELLNISKASAIGDMAFSHILNYIDVGITEIEVANEIEKKLMSLGGEALSFDTICVSGERTALPHGEPTSKVIEPGDFVTMDFGVLYKGQCGDMTRTIAMGYVTEEMETVYNVVLKAQELALNALKAGVSSFAIDKIARDYIEKFSYGEYFVHGTGHGVGVEVHEEPYLNTRTDTVLCENMAVTVEPGIYIPNKFGVRIEDLALITDFGIINTVKSTKELIVI